MLPPFRIKVARLILMSKFPNCLMGVSKSIEERGMSRFWVISYHALSQSKAGIIRLKQAASYSSQPAVWASLILSLLGWHGNKDEGQH